MRGKKREQYNCYRKDNDLDLDSNMDEKHKTTGRSLLTVRPNAAWNRRKK